MAQARAKRGRINGRIATRLPMRPNLNLWERSGS
jgi:hypothetical protein